MHGAYIFTIAVLIAVIAALVTLYNEQGAKIERLQRLLDERERIIKSNSNSNSNSNTVIAARPNNVYGNETQYHIRKLTPVETGRLMGLRDNEIQKMLDCGLSNSAMYKLYGNSIVVDVLYHVFRTMFISNQSENNTINLFNYDTKN
jgi:site-specific DNA-cytosine methylase